MLGMIRIMRKGLLFLLPVCLLGLAFVLYQGFPQDTYEVLDGLEGPAEISKVSEEAPTAAKEAWKNAEAGRESRLAVLLTDPESAWVGIQQALETMGIPYIFTTNAARAARHQVVLVYPMISGKYLNHEQQEILRRHVAEGGCLLATQVLNEDLKDLFGFAGIQETRQHYEVNFTPGQALTGELDHERERTVRLGNPERPDSWIGTQHYLEPQQVIATYQDGTAAWIAKQHPGGGQAMALGFDFGFYILKCQNDRDDEASRSYVNDYEPSVDVWLRLLRSLYRKYEPLAVTVDTVPEDKRVAAILSFDIDYAKSVGHLKAYQDLLVKNGVPATFFVQAKYYRDYFDSGFFNDESVGLLRMLQQTGMEIASHSVSHTDVFATLPLGDGTERYPGYQPRVHNLRDTRKATILGELRVSKFLLEKVVGGEVCSFRPGYLACPESLPQALEATGYAYSSSVTGANVMTYLPYRKTFDRQYAAATSVYEFPVAVEDEHEPKMDQRVNEAVVLAERLARYGGSFTVLSHPNVLDHKFRFFEQIIPRLKSLAWIGTLQQYGDWWSAREKLELDIIESGGRITLDVTAPHPVKGVTLLLPPDWLAQSTLPENSRLEDGRLFLSSVAGKLSLTFQKK